jgi:alpha-galactosidase
MVTERSLQHTSGYAYVPGVMMAWVTDSPTWVNQRVLSLEYRFLSSMQGSLGIGANLNNWKPEDFTTAKKKVWPDWSSLLHQV